MKKKHLATLSTFVLLALLVQSMSPASLDADAKGKKGKVRTSGKVKPYPPEFAEAIRLVLIEKKYKQAHDIFAKLDKNGFCRDKTHYYIALCLHNMNQTVAAAQHYELVYNYSKDPQLKYLASVGYSQVSRYAASRTYAGQGNLFARYSAGGGNSGGPWSGGACGGGGGG